MIVATVAKLTPSPVEMVKLVLIQLPRWNSVAHFDTADTVAVLVTNKKLNCHSSRESAAKVSSFTQIPGIVLDKSIVTRYTVFIIHTQITG